MSEQKDPTNLNINDKNVNAINNNNVSQTIQGISSIVTERIMENPEQQNNLKNQLNINEKSNSTIAQDTAHPHSHWVVLESLLERNGLATKPTTFSLEVIGIYSLPDFWIKWTNPGQWIPGDIKSKLEKLNVSMVN